MGNSFKKIFLILIVTLAAILTSYSQNTDRLVNHYKQKITTYLDKENALADFYLIDSSGVKIFSSAAAKHKDSVEFFVRWNEIDAFNESVCLFDNGNLLDVMRTKGTGFFKKYDTTCTHLWLKPENGNLLTGLRIAIDPGHVAGDMNMAKMEKKFIDMKFNSQRGTVKKYEFMEAQLTLATGLILRKKLEIAGAQVMMTHETSGVTAFGITYNEWLATRFKQMLDSAYLNKDIDEKQKLFLSTKATKTEIFRQFFFNVENKERARRINSFHPDLTVVIHYNVDETNEGWKKPSARNFCMAFVGGSFMKDELDKPDKRLAFLRLLLSDNIEKSIDACSMVINSCSSKLSVPLAQQTDAEYLVKNSLPTGSAGVYCRNLTLTRLVQGAVVYGETLYQDNENELPRLGFNTLSVDGVPTSERVKQVADGYYEGILKYFKTAK